MFKIKWGKVRRFIFGLPLINIENTWKSDIDVETPTKTKLRTCIVAFVTGLNTAIEAAYSQLLICQLEGMSDNCRGFAYEGAGMGLAIIDYTRNKGLVAKFLAKEAAKYPELIYVGVGCATSLLKKDLEPKMRETEPMQRWWIPNGFGFYSGIYKWEESVEQHFVPQAIKGYALRCFDRGLGRRMWFGFSGNVTAVAQAIAKFPKSRQADLWSGIGLASTFAGGIEREALVNLKGLAGEYAPDLAVGSAMAAKCRYTAGNMVDYTHVACLILCGVNGSEVGAMVDRTFHELNVDPNESIEIEQPVFETMRQNLRTQFARVPATTQV